MQMNHFSPFRTTKRTSRRTLTSPAIWSVLAAGCCVLFGVTGSAIAADAAAALSDAEVLGIYIQVNGFDVETALLGRAQASSNVVRDLATQVSADHQGVRQTAFDVAAKCNVTPVLPATRDVAAAEHGRALARLTALKGAAFDQAYVQHEVAFHRAAIDAVKKVLLPATTCPALKAHFEAILPAFEHHLSETEALARKLNAR